MAKKFTRRRWRRPQRLTLEGPPPTRRKDIVVPDVLDLSPGEALPENRRRMAVLLGAFFLLCACEGALIALVAGPFWLTIPGAAGLGLAYLAAGARYGDRWLQGALAASPQPPPHARNVLDGVCGTAGVQPPELYVGPGETPNALSLNLGRRWIVVTPGATRLPRLELEAVMAHELAHLRDGDAALASAYVLLAGAMELSGKAVHSARGFLAFLSLPLWPACITLKLLRPLLFPAEREHRADVVGALMTRYPPGMQRALEAAAVEQSTSRFPITDPFWFAPRHPAGPAVPDRARAVAEM